MFIRTRGFSLVDVVVGIGLMLVMFVALFGVLKASLSLSALAKAKAAGVELANTQMEYLRGLSYDALGTVGGIPAGLIAQSATSTVDGIVYNTRTFIEYQDDPADGTGASDSNAITTDYKDAKITVTYILHGLAKTVSLVSNFVPQGIETSTGGGTLSLHIVNASGANVSNAAVQIINNATTPTINVTTYSNVNGIVLLGGAATSSQFQILVSKTGYSSAQTYAVAGQNANPSPGYLTVVKNQTTSSTFAIDLMSALTLSTYSPATTTTFFDTFSSGANISTSTNTTVTGGALTLSVGQTTGSALAIPYGPSYLSAWQSFSATLSTTTGTTAIVQLYDNTGTLIPDSALPGNSTGFTTFPVNISSLSTTTYPNLSLGASLTTSTTTKPSVLDWTLSATNGPAPLANVAFTLTGAKTIGSTGGGSPIYKTVTTSSSGSTAKVTLPLEWDSYKLSGVSYDIADACGDAPPYGLTPNVTDVASLYLVASTANSLFVPVADNAGLAVPGATVQLTKSGFSQTLSSSSCGNAYFGSIPAGTYTVTISKTGYTTKAFSGVVVSGSTSYIASFP